MSFEYTKYEAPSKNYQNLTKIRHYRYFLRNPPPSPHQNLMRAHHSLGTAALVYP